jgi:hypothetical protein
MDMDMDMDIDIDIDMDMDMDIDMDMENVRKMYGRRLEIVIFERFHLRRGLACGFSYGIGYHPRPI